jgi:hypothetical protein
LGVYTLKNEEIRMKKLVLLCTMLATLACLAYAEYQVNAPGYEAAKPRYWQLMEKAWNGSATDAENAELADLCYVYGWELPVAEPAESDSRGNPNGTLDAGTDCAGATIITSCPFGETVAMDGDNDCALTTPSISSPYNDLFYQFTPTVTGRYQFRVRNYTTGASAIRIVKGSCCETTTILRAYTASSGLTDCNNPLAPGFEPSTVVSYLYAYLSADTTYWIHIGTSSSTVSTANIEFNMWCWGCPPDESTRTPVVHNTCATAQEMFCPADSVFGDSASWSTPTTWDWYKVVVPDYSPNACSLYVFVGSREMGHCISGRYPTANAYDGYAVDGRFSMWKERAGEPCVIDSVIGGYGYDDGCSYDALRTVAVDPGTYYIKVANDNLYEYVVKTRCIEYNPMAACCFLDASCQNMAQSACAAAGGWSKPMGVLCETNPCATSPCPYENWELEPNNICGPNVQQVFCETWYCGAIGINTDVDWYKLVIADCESLVVDIFGNATPSQWPYLQGLNPYVYLYASDCATIVASNDNNSGVDPDPVGNDSRMKTVVGPGTYYIKVNSSGNLTSGPYVMHIMCIWRECLAGDFCTNATEVGCPSATPGTTVGYLIDTPPLCVYTPGSPGVWFKLVGNGFMVTADVCISSFDTRMNVYRGDCDNLICVGADDDACDAPNGVGSKVTWCAKPDSNYYILVYGYSTYTGTFTLTITPGSSCATGACCNPATGACTQKTLSECTAQGGNFLGYGIGCDPNPCPQPCLWPNRDDELVNNTCGVTNPLVACGDTLCGTITSTADSDWYQIVIPEGVCDTVVVRVYADDTPGWPPYNQGLDPTVTLRAANCVTQLAYNDDNNGVVPEPVHFDSKITSGCLVGGTYYIKVASPYGSGPYVLVVQCIPCECPVHVSGDNCADPRVIASLPYTDTGSTCNFVDDYNATCLGYYDGGPDVIYKFTVTTQTCATCSLVNVTASSYPGLAVFDGCPDVGTCLTFKTGSSGPLGTSCLVFEPGHDYYIMVDNWPSPACINAYTLKLDACECPHPCEWYTLCGNPGEVEPNDVCPVVNQPVIGCDMTVYGLHCPSTDVDYWQVVVPPMTIMTLQLFSGMNCDVTPAAGVLFQYYDDQCATPSTGTTSPIIINNSTANPLVKWLKVYDNANSVTLYKVVATCCQIRDYCADPIYTGAGMYANGVWSFDSTVNTCCATNVIDTVWSHGCGLGSKFASGPDVIFKFILATPNLVRSISANSVGSGDGQFYVFTDCANPKGTCIASEDYTTGTTPETVTNLLLPAGTYYVAVSHYTLTACGMMHLHIASDCPLPVELLGDVVARAGSEKVTLTWATASETNSDRFEIVRNDRMIGRVSAAGTSPSRHDYAWSEEGLNNGMTYTYTLRSVDINGRANDLATVSATPSFAAGEVTEYALHQNYPNPFNPVTTIAFDLLEAGNVHLKIYNLMGQEVRTVVSGMMPKGRHVVSFDAGDLSSGVYLYRIEVNGFEAEKKMLLMK